MICSVCVFLLVIRRNTSHHHITSSGPSQNLGPVDQHVLFPVWSHDAALNVVGRSARVHSNSANLCFYSSLESFCCFSVWRPVLLGSAPREAGLGRNVARSQPNSSAVSGLFCASCH